MQLQTTYENVELMCAPANIQCRNSSLRCIHSSNSIQNWKLLNDFNNIENPGVLRITGSAQQTFYAHHQFTKKKSLLYHHHYHSAVVRPDQTQKQKQSSNNSPNTNRKILFYPSSIQFSSQHNAVRSNLCFRNYTSLKFEN